MPTTQRPGKGGNDAAEEETPVAGAGRSVQAAIGANTAGGPREGEAQHDISLQRWILASGVWFTRITP